MDGGGRRFLRMLRDRVWVLLADRLWAWRYVAVEHDPSRGLGVDIVDDLLDAAPYLLFGQVSPRGGPSAIGLRPPIESPYSGACGEVGDAR